MIPPGPRNRPRTDPRTWPAPTRSAARPRAASGVIAREAGSAAAVKVTGFYLAATRSARLRCDLMLADKLSVMALALPLDVIVCTLDEEANLRRCLESVAWASNRFVVDAVSAH